MREESFISYDEYNKLLVKNRRLKEALTGMYRIYCELDGREDVIHQLEECRIARELLNVPQQTEKD